MICVSNACGQHSGRCPTPWTCGKYESEAKHTPVPFVVIEESDEPISSPESFGNWLYYGGIALVVIVACALVIAVIRFALSPLVAISG